uniref:Uncharacterized protein n=1 Tax=Pipistrellus kuhlii TaxID=59472 RepID=A0A7J7ZJU5_PIPKU|nr:hypothetical protein mPipKuh1_009528 [Pipistrellus kuhlii]
MAGAQAPARWQSEQQPVVLLVYVLEEDKELENEACAILGGSDSKKKYYFQGPSSKLYTCKVCVKTDGNLDALFLTDEYDTVLADENKGKVDQVADRTDPLTDTLNSMNRVQQVELTCEHYDLKTERKDHLKRFADKGTVVKRAHPAVL